MAVIAAIVKKNVTNEIHFCIRVISNFFLSKRETNTKTIVYEYTIQMGNGLAKGTMAKLPINIVK